MTNRTRSRCAYRPSSTPSSSRPEHRRSCPRACRGGHRRAVGRRCDGSVRLPPKPGSRQRGRGCSGRQGQGRSCRRCAGFDGRGAGLTGLGREPDGVLGRGIPDSAASAATGRAAWGGLGGAAAGGRAGVGTIRPMFSAADHDHMTRALALAAQGLYTTHAQPACGLRDREGWRGRRRGLAPACRRTSCRGRGDGRMAQAAPAAPRPM
jgi:hypothetical protein